MKKILTEVLPYLHITRTEEMTIAEQEEIDNILGNIMQNDTTSGEGEEGENSENGGQEGGEGTGGENGDTPSSSEGDGSDPTSSGPSYTVDPDTGELVNPDTGEKAEMDYAIEDNESDDNNNGTQAGDENPDNAQ